jgi:tRNA-dihydrouridine synthase A
MNNSMNNRKIAVAPMMDWTDRHCRYFMRTLSPSIRLYTEMVTAAALKHGDANKLLEYDLSEHPLALQVGGSEPGLMAQAAVMAADRGYDEININVGCPSDRVQSGSFGACLMSRPGTVADCVRAMQEAGPVPVTVKTRIGIDDLDSYTFVRDFVAAIAEAGCKTVIVHARIAILSGLSPKDNRSVPALNYDRVYRLKQEFPDLAIVLNGGIRTIGQVHQHLEQVDGVMIGRQAYQHPWFLCELQQVLGDSRMEVPASRVDAVTKMLPYVERELARGVLLKHITRHMLGLFAGQPGARGWRRYLSEHAHRSGAGPEVLQQALLQMAQAA